MKKLAVVLAGFGVAALSSALRDHARTGAGGASGARSPAGTAAGDSSRRRRRKPAAGAGRAAATPLPAAKSKPRPSARTEQPEAGAQAAGGTGGRGRPPPRQRAQAGTAAGIARTPTASSRASGARHHGRANGLRAGVNYQKSAPNARRPTTRPSSHRIAEGAIRDAKFEYALELRTRRRRWRRSSRGSSRAASNCPGRAVTGR